MRLLTIQRKSVVLLHVDSGHVDFIQTLGSDPVALTFDVARGWYYWADDHGNIYRSDGKYSSTLFTG